MFGTHIVIRKRHLIFFLLGAKNNYGEKTENDSFRSVLSITANGKLQIQMLKKWLCLEL